MIDLIDIHKTIDGKKVLDGLTLHIEQGETMVVIGRSGSGKSVTFKHIMGLWQPDSGQVLVDGVDVAKARNSQLYEVRRRLGVLFQSGRYRGYKKNVWESRRIKADSKPIPESVCIRSRPFTSVNH